MNRTNLLTKIRRPYRAVHSGFDHRAKVALHLRDVLKQVISQRAQQRIVFIKSWNEWSEGNHLEPDIRFGLGYLEAVKNELDLVRSRHACALHEAHS